MAFLGTNVAITVIGLATTALLTFVLTRSWSEPPPLTLAFEATIGCPGGKLDYLKKRHFGDVFVELTRGADRLVICDTEVLVTTRADAPSALARKYPGCLRWIGTSLSLLRASPSVCSLPGGNRFICDGANARTYPGSAGLGSDNQPITECSPDVLRRFGFQK